MTVERRRRVLVDLPFQLRHLFPVLIAGMAGAIAGSGFGLGLGALTQTAGHGHLQVLVSPWLSAAFGLVTFAALAHLQLLHSHRTAGPALRLRRDLQRLGDGDLSVDPRLREADELQELSEAVGHASAALRARVSEAQSAAATLRRAVVRVGSGTGEDEEGRDELVKAVQRLEAALGHFRTTPGSGPPSAQGPLPAPERVQFIPSWCIGPTRIRRQRLPLGEGV